MSAEIEIVDLVGLDLVQRKKMGAAKYGRPLLAHTIADPLKEAYDEGLDLVIYLRAEIERRGGRRSP